MGLTDRIGGQEPILPTKYLPTINRWAKLTGFIQWSWIWVLAPIWGPIVAVLAVVAIFACALLIAKLID